MLHVHLVGLYIIICYSIRNMDFSLPSVDEVYWIPNEF